MKQSRIDSLMEAAVNILIGTTIYTLVNHTVLAAILGIPISVGTSLWISVVFTVVSFARTFAIRRLFNGRSPWEAMKGVWTGLVRFHRRTNRRPYHMIAVVVVLAIPYVLAEKFVEWCDNL